jgi:hypothetical protein
MSASAATTSRAITSKTAMPPTLSSNVRCSSTVLSFQ